ncbi:peptidoglycan recognition protein family protein [Gracilimonas sp. BCB1]|uniref:peptidoglycan recognition protein family protein n=1 Tax=Gracilimonas sp. BCB1 TaxID=3152362 RepID=UPI0032D954B0
MKILTLLFSLVFWFTLLIPGFQVEKPDIISVEDWGGKPPSGEVEEHEIRFITIHHAGVEMPEDADPKEKLQGLQRFSQNDKNWIDIPYHFSIDLEGNIYENRPLKYPGDTNTEYDPTGHALIQVLGNYEVQKVNDKQLDAIAHLSAWLAQEYDVSTDAIATHKDYSDQTVCPGEDLYKYFEDGTIINRIQKLLKK